jgi:signal transduction histidine kinase/streptogramin lyase
VKKHALILGFFCSFYLSAQTGFRYDVRYIGLQNGLDERVVRDICEDKNGAIWISTQKDLYLYGGVTVTSFKKRHKPPLPFLDFDIKSIESDPDQHLWICTKNGLFILNTTDHTICPPSYIGIPDSVFQQTNCRVTRANNHDLFLFAGTSLYRYSKGILTHYANVPADAVQEVYYIRYSDANKLLYVAAEKPSQIFSVNSAGKIDYLNAPVMIGNQTQPFSICWKTMATIRGDSISMLLNMDHVAGIAYSIQLDPARQLYTHTEADNLGRLLPAWQAALDYTEAHPDVSPASFRTNFLLYKIIRDRHGNYWFATTNGLLGVQEHHPSFQHIAATKDNSIRGIVQDDYHHLWISGYAGLQWYDPTHAKSRVYQYPNLVWNFMPVGKDSFLTGAERINSIQLLKISRNGNITVSTPPTLSAVNYMLSMAHTPDGIWAGEINRVLFLKMPDLKVDFFSSEEFKSGSIGFRSTLFSPWSGLWLGSTAGLFHFKLNLLNNAIETSLYAQIPNTLKHAHVNTILETRDHAIWIGTSGNGLYQLNPVTLALQQFTFDDGLADNNVYSIMSSHSDSVLWVGTQHGLSRFNIIQHKFYNFYNEDGLGQNEFNTGARYQSPEGIYYFGGVDGVSFFDPNKIPTFDHTDFPYANLNILKNGAAISRTLTAFNQATIDILPDEHFVEILFRSTDLFQVNLSEFRYKFDWTNDEWQYVHASDKAIFTRLSPGIYKLTIQVKSPDGHWSQHTHIALNLLPYWYETWWFRTLAIALSVGLFYLFYQFRISQIRREFEIRKQVSDDLHDDLGGRLYAIRTMAAQMTANQPTPGNEQGLSHHIDALSKSAIETIRDFIWILDPKNDRLQAFIDRLEQYAVLAIFPLVRQKSFHTDHIPVKIKFSAIGRHDFLLIYQELLTNMVKHTNSVEININAVVEHGQLRVMIQNTNEGIISRPSIPEDGSVGLSSIQNRASRHKINLNWQETEGLQIAMLAIQL